MEITAKNASPHFKRRYRPKEGQRGVGAGLAGVVRKPNLDPHGVTQ